MSLLQLHNFFNPKTIAVVGASDRENSVGGAVLKNIKDGGFAGQVFAVNNHSKTAQGQKTYPSVLEIDEKIDLAVIAVPAAAALEVLEQCGKTKTGGAIIVSSGFKEAGAAGKAMFEKIVAGGKKHNVKILGPNCLGFINPRAKLNASFAPAIPASGGIAFISQSGALCDTFLDWSLRDNIGFSHFVSLGSMADIGFDELIDYFDTDQNVSSIMMYVESINDARKFISSARAFAKTKPIVCLKSGLNPAGAKAAASHTGALAGDDKAFNAAFYRAGIIRTKTVSGFFNYAKTLNHVKLPAGNRLAIITNAGGPGVISTDFLTNNGGKLAELSIQTIKDLDPKMPPAWSRANPVDVLGDGNPENYRAAVSACLEDQNADGAIVIVSPQAVTQAKKIAQEIASLENIGKKPVFASLMGAAQVKAGVEVFRAAGIPVYRTPEKAIACFLGLNRWQENLRALETPPQTIPQEFKPDVAAAREIIKDAIKNRQTVLAGAIGRKFLECYGLAANPAYLAKTKSQAAAIAKRIGFPVAVKLEAAGLLHKTEVGGVRLNLNNSNSVKKAFDQIQKNARQYLDPKDIAGITVEKMIAKKFELIAGAKSDPIFGPVIIFGMGGVAVEVFNDVAAGLPPLNMALAKNLIEQTKISALLKGFRGLEGANFEELQFFLYKFSYLLADFPQIKEVDINPLAADKNGVLIVDAKVVLDSRIDFAKAKPYSHLAILPYPKEYESRTILKNGQKIFLRPIMAEDEPRHREFLANLSEDARRFRFFGPVEINAKFARHFTQIDYDRENAIIAQTKIGGKTTTIGVARLIENVLDQTAEFAIVVADAWQQMGLGKKLTDQMIKIARDKKYQKIYLNFLNDNIAVKALVKKEGFAVTEGEDSGYAELNIEY